jgi:hypothetical protein
MNKQTYTLTVTYADTISIKRQAIDTNTKNLIVLSLTQENVIDLRSVGIPFTLATTVGGKHTEHVKTTSLSHCMIFPLVAICLMFRFITNVKPSLCIALPTQNTKRNAQNTTAR